MDHINIFVKRTAYCVALLWLVAGMPRILLAQGVPTSVEGLDPETRKQYEELRAELEEAREAIADAEERAYGEDPLLRAAVEGERETRKLETEAGRLYFQVKKHYEKKGKNAFKAFRRWKGCYGEVMGYSRISKELENPELRKFHLWFANKVAEEWDSTKSFHGSELIRDLLPPDMSELSSERVLEIYTIMLQRNRDLKLAKLPELEKSADPPDFAREYVDKMSEASGLLMMYGAYVAQNTPDYVKEARNGGKDIATRLTQLWPNWGQAEETAHWKAHDEARRLGAALVQSSKKWVLIAINVAIVAALLILLVWRRGRRQQCVLCIATLFFLMGPLAIRNLVHAQSDAKTVEELDPETRKRYEELHAELQEAITAIAVAEEQAYEDPLLKGAVDGLQKARELEAETGRLRTKVNLYYQKQGADTEKRYRRWDSLYGEVEGVEAFEQAAKDSALRPYILPFFSAIAKEMAGDDLDVSNMSSEKAFDRYLNMVKQNRDHISRDYQKIKERLNPPSFVIEYAETREHGDLLFGIYDAYIRCNTPISVKEARVRSGDIASELTRLWPNWGQAEEAAHLKARDEARRLGVALVQSSKKWWLIAINIAVVTALVLLIVWKRKRQPGA